MRIIFTGDIHLDSTTPLSRLDNYAEATIEKLNKLHQLCLDNKVEVVVFPGDIFEKYDAPTWYMIMVIEALQKFAKDNIKIFSTIGNHDLPHNKKEYFTRTPLKLLFNAGLITYIDMDKSPSGIELDSSGEVLLHGIDFTDMHKVKNMNDGLNQDKLNIITVHYALNHTIPNESISYTDLNNFDYVLSGHDHMPYDLHKLGKTTYMRPGSFTRRTKDYYNLNRDIIVYMLDTDNKELKDLSLGVKPAEEVFKNAVFEGGPTNIDLFDFSGAFDKLNEQSGKMSLYSIIDFLIKENRITEKTANSIKKELTSLGYTE